MIYFFKEKYIIRINDIKKIILIKELYINVSFKFLKVVLADFIIFILIIILII
jgi:hypothetical protein